MKKPEMKNRVGVILAAGHGMRLRPATELCPKPLIPVAGIEPLFFAIEKYYRAGIRRLVVNTHYLHEQVELSLAEWRRSFPDLELRLSHETHILGTGGALHKIIYENQDWLQDSGLIVQNGDTVSGFCIERMLSEHEQNLFAVSKKEEHLKKYNTLWLGKDGEWSGIGKTPRKQEWESAHFLGTHTLSACAVQKILKFIEPDQESDLFNAVYRPLVDAGETISSVEFFTAEDKDNFWFDMTNQEFFLEAQNYILNQCLDPFWLSFLKRRYPEIKEHSKGVWVSSELSLSHSSVRAPCIIIAQPNSKVLRLLNGAGPSFCWIEKESVEPNGWSPGQLKGATVYIHRKTTLTKDVLSNDIQNRVVVL